jgi:signal transduction histidine kinase|tara:strand:- start:1590 stop:1835 length:246 start_codon:yes stop_codon:yes gene_type:complete
MEALANTNKRIAMNNNESLRKMVHDARAPLNRISMNAELVKLVLENDMPKQKALEALNKIIANCQQCSEQLQEISDTHAAD